MKAITVKLEEQVREREKRIKESEEERTRLEKRAEYENYRRGCEKLQKQNSNLRTGTAELRNELETKEQVAVRRRGVERSQTAREEELKETKIRKEILEKS